MFICSTPFGGKAHCQASSQQKHLKLLAMSTYSKHLGTGCWAIQTKHLACSLAQAS